MKTLARCVAVFLLVLLFAAQLVSLGMREGWDAAAFLALFIALLFGSVWYGFIVED